MFEKLNRIMPILAERGVNGYVATQDDVDKLAATEWSSLDIDSLGVYEVAMECEERFDIQIIDDDLENIRTLGEFAELVNQKVMGK